MKKIIFWLPLLVLMITFASCTKKVDSNGLTKDITDFVPDSILTSMVDQGMPIQGGNEPPNIEGTYTATPFDLVSSTVPDDPESHTFSDFIVTFKNFNKHKLTIELDYENGPETGTGMGSFIVGDGDKFTVFVEVKSTQLYIFKSVATLVITGTFTDDGIKDLYVANFMLDNKGNEGGLWIPNGTGRVVYDSDGFSEKTGNAKSSHLVDNGTSTLSNNISK